MSIRSSKLSWITVSDLQKSRKFYENVLGLKLLEEDTNIEWLEFQGKNGGTMLGIAQANGPCSKELPGSNAIMTFEVDDIVKTKSQFEQNGVTFLGPTIKIGNHVKLAFFVDEDGNKFQLVEEIKKE